MIRIPILSAFSRCTPLAHDTPSTTTASRSDSTAKGASGGNRLIHARVRVHSRNGQLGRTAGEITNAHTPSPQRL
jgi:hypothetical protein